MKLALILSVAILACITKSTASNTTEANPAIKNCPCPTNVTETSIEPPKTTQSTWPSSHMDHLYHTMIHGTPCICNFRLHHTRDDYIYSNGLGAHKLHTRAATWNDARKMCNEEGAHLAIINSVAEAQILMDIFNRSGPIKGATYQNVAFLGIHDLYKEGEWVTILGDSLYKTGYTKWSDKWGGQPDNGSGKQNCGVLLKEGDLDDVFCDAPFAFFCELPSIKF